LQPGETTEQPLTTFHVMSVHSIFVPSLTCWRAVTGSAQERGVRLIGAAQSRS
jgi:formyltetrahydrofolate hydrolase